LDQPSRYNFIFPLCRHISGHLRDRATFQAERTDVELGSHDNAMPAHRMQATEDQLRGGCESTGSGTRNLGEGAGEEKDEVM